ncbi:MAG TPA: hypothetical protein VG055_10075 [Planctomycetaceae bacterium]|jgi:hypothetical protein|nr:hypothetical protein [Planctomycetaceae bacterium]
MPSECRRWWFRFRVSVVFCVGSIVISIAMPIARSGAQDRSHPTAQQPLVAPGPDTPTVIAFLQRIIDGRERADRPLATRWVRGRVSLGWKGLPRRTRADDVPARPPAIQPQWRLFSEVRRNGKGRVEEEVTQDIGGHQRTVKSYRLTQGDELYLLNGAELAGNVALYILPLARINDPWFDLPDGFTQCVAVPNFENMAPVEMVCRVHIARLKNKTFFGNEKGLELRCYEEEGRMVVEVVGLAINPRHALTLVKFWVDPRIGYQLVKKEVHSGEPGGALYYEEQGEVEYSQLAPGVYFPKRGKLTITNLGTLELRDGGAGWGIRQFEVTSVALGDFKFNERFFDPESLPLTAGTLVQDQRSNPPVTFTYQGPSLTEALASAKQNRTDLQRAPR